MNQDFLDSLASGEPAPGGGAATAMLVATGAALLAMVCRLTVGRPRYAEHEEIVSAALAEADRARAAAVALAGEDADAYRAVIAAQGLPRGSEEERRERAARLQEALKGATEVPLRTLSLAGEVAALLDRVAERVNPNVLGDVVVGAMTTRAALDGAELNALLNLAYVRDGAYVAAARARAQPVAAEGRLALDRVLALGSRIG